MPTRKPRRKRVLIPDLPDTWYWRTVTSVDESPEDDNYILWGLRYDVPQKHPKSGARELLREGDAVLRFRGDEQIEIWRVQNTELVRCDQGLYRIKRPHRPRLWSAIRCALSR